MTCAASLIINLSVKCKRGEKPLPPYLARIRITAYNDHHHNSTKNASLPAYYTELGLRMKKKKHGQLLSVKDMFKWRTKTP